MKKWKAIRVKQELVDQVQKEVKKSEYQSLSEFVSDAVRQHLQTLTRQRVYDYLEQDKAVSPPQLKPQLFYTPKHTWAKLTDEGTVEVGITDYFQGQLREIVNIQTVVAGEEVSQDEPFGVAESWWFTYDLYSPLKGKIVELNQKVMDNPFLLNADPSQWIVRIQPNSAEVSSWARELLSQQKYRAIATVQ